MLGSVFLVDAKISAGLAGMVVKIGMICSAVVMQKNIQISG